MKCQGRVSKSTTGCPFVSLPRYTETHEFPRRDKRLDVSVYRLILLTSLHQSSGTRAGSRVGRIGAISFVNEDSWTFAYLTNLDQSLNCPSLGSFSIIARVHVYPLLEGILVRHCRDPCHG